MASPVHVGPPPRRTVWILGAGFSKPLGGPLLFDLLSPATNTFVQALYSTNAYIGWVQQEAFGRQKPYRLATLLVRDLFRRFGPTADPGIRQWDDAEMFLDELDAAAQGADRPAARRLGAVLDRMAGDHREFDVDYGWSEVRESARRLVTAACCAFLKKADTTEERWQPFVSWSEDLLPSDTIVTFNYDRIPELLGQVQVIVPGKLTRVPKPRHICQVLKLHGSVDWWRAQKGNEVGYRKARNSEYSLVCKPDQIGIATPGASKKIAVNELSVLWNEAEERIRTAEVLVFVGYRFPPSDAEARGRLLRAIRLNESKHLDMHVVLGPARNSDVERLEQMLRYMVVKKPREEIRHDGGSGYSRKGELPESFRLTTHALYAQDFFTVWDRTLLWPWDADGP